jgi:hypothetical protein
MAVSMGISENWHSDEVSALLRQVRSDKSTLSIAYRA